MSDPFAQSSRPTGDPHQPSSSTGQNRRLWKFGIGCGVLLLLAVIGLSLVVGPFIAKSLVARSKSEEKEKAYFNPPPGMKLVVKDRDKVPVNLHPYFMPFYFHCPEKFKAVPDDTNFVRYEETVNESVLESFAVGPIPSALSTADGRFVFPPIMKKISSRFATVYPNYQEISQGSEDLPYQDDCWGMRWQAEDTDASGRPFPVYGRVLLVRNYQDKIGFVISMIATLDPEVHSAQEVGVKGDLARILPTFKIRRRTSPIRPMDGDGG